LSKKTVYCFSGAEISTGMMVDSMPGLSVSTMNSDSLPLPFSSTPVRATTRTAPDSSMPEM
jgi:hypothetical protein